MWRQQREVAVRTDAASRARNSLTKTNTRATISFPEQGNETLTFRDLSAVETTQNCLSSLQSNCPPDVPNVPKRNHVILQPQVLLLQVAFFDSDVMKCSITSAWRK